MNEQSRVLVASLAGAAIGAVVGYLYLTDRGRRLREQVEPRLDDLTRELQKLRSTINKAQEVVDEGRRSLNELTGERSRPREWSGPRQASSY